MKSKTVLWHVLKEATNENSENLHNVIFSKPQYVRSAGTFCIWLEIKMQLDKYFGSINFSISTVFRTSRCVTYNIWTGRFLKPHRGFKFIIFSWLKDFVIVFFTSWLIFITCNKILQEIQAKIDSEDYENVPSLETFLSFCWIGLIDWIDFDIIYTT